MLMLVVCTHLSALCGELAELAPSLRHQHTSPSYSRYSNPHLIYAKFLIPGEVNLNEEKQAFRRSHTPVNINLINKSTSFLLFAHFEVLFTCKKI